MQKWKWNSSSHLSCRPAASLEEQNLHFSPLASFLGNSCTFLHLEGCLGEFLTAKLLSKNTSAQSWTLNEFQRNVSAPLLRLSCLLAPTGALWTSFQYSRSSPFILSWECERGLLWFEKVFAGNCSENPSIYLFCRHRWHPIQGLISVSQIFKHSNIWSHFDANI